MGDDLMQAVGSYHFKAALYDGLRPVFPRPGFAFQRTGRPIFFLGFNKTATTALYYLLLSAGIRTLHHGGNGKLFGRPQGEQDKIRHVSVHILENLQAGRRALEGLEDYDAFIDLTVGTQEGVRHFKTLDQQYPDALFVLNHRAVEPWLVSRRKHRRMARHSATELGWSVGEVIEHWRQLHQSHHSEVRGHFRNSERFCDVDIAGPIAPLITFFARHDILIDPANWFCIRKTGAGFLEAPLRALQADVAVPIFPETRP